MVLWLLVACNKTEEITNLKLKIDKVGIHYLPPFKSKRMLDEKYCFKSEHVVKLNNPDKHMFFTECNN